MILQALHQLYDRFEEDPKYDVAPEGYSLQKISFVVVINADGSHPEIQDVRIDGKSPPRRVLGTAKPSGSGINPRLLWDNTGYLLGYKKDDPKPERTLETFEASKAYHKNLENAVNHPQFSAVCRFFEAWDPSSPSIHAMLDELSTGFGVFQIRNTKGFIHEEGAIVEWWENQFAETSKESASATGRCLVTGEDAAIAELHEPKIKGVKDAQGAGALIVSFNKNAYESFGKESGAIAPVSKNAAARYCKVLNALLSGDQHRLQIGDATTVFWTEIPTRTESILLNFFGGQPKKDESDTPVAAQRKQLLDALKSSLRAIKKGGDPDPRFKDEYDRSFYILGLTGQAGGRIGIRFWYQSSIGNLLSNLAAHHNDLAIASIWGPGSKKPDPEFPQAWMLLSQTARDSKGIPPNLGSALMRSILTGSNYPTMLAERVLSRIRVPEKDQNDKPRERVSYIRAAILKAFLNRNHKLNMGEALDNTKSRKEPAYHLGRLFAVYETAQRHAHDWKLERTIRETMYSAASATPLSVFGRLERLHHHHTAKKSHPPGSSESYAQIVGEIQQNFQQEQIYPRSLNLIDQSLFAVGYYHQLHYFDTLKKAAQEKKRDSQD